MGKSDLAAGISEGTPPYFRERPVGFFAFHPALKGRLKQDHAFSAPRVDDCTRQRSRRRGGCRGGRGAWVRREAKGMGKQSSAPGPHGRAGRERGRARGEKG